MEVTPILIFLLIAKVAYSQEGECDRNQNGVIEKFNEETNKKIRIISVDRFITETTISEIRKQGNPLSKRKVRKNYLC